MFSRFYYTCQRRLTDGGLTLKPMQENRIRCLMKKFVLIGLACLLSSCMFYRQATELPVPQPRQPSDAYYETVLSPVVGSKGEASIGDIVLSYSKYLYSPERVITTPPRGLRIPPQTGWIKTHQYQSMDVYTHSQYYKGSMGVALNTGDRVVWYVQTGGMKAGRRWHGSGTPFFGRDQTLVDQWRLRYNGRSQGSYKFEIVESKQDKAFLATQSFAVSEESFLGGFVVRGVLIRGATTRRNETISYQIVGEKEKAPVMASAKKLSARDLPCDPDYKRVGQQCKKIIVLQNNSTTPHRRDRRELQRELDLYRGLGISGDDCQTEYKTNAKSCVKITNKDLDCSEDFYDNSYRGCDVTLKYDVNTDYSGGTSLNVDLQCQVNIEYQERDSYLTRSDSKTSDDSHTLFAWNHDRGEMTFSFAFGSYEEVTNVEIDSAKCEIENVALY